MDVHETNYNSITNSIMKGCTRTHAGERERERERGREGERERGREGERERGREGEGGREILSTTACTVYVHLHVPENQIQFHLMTS